MKLNFKKIFVFLAIALANSCVRSAEVVDAFTIRDLELTAGVNKNHAGICEALAKPQTAAGKILLPEMMTNPLVEVTEIVKRQDVLKALVADPQLLVRLEDLLFNVAENEKILATFDPEKRSDSLDEMLNTLFFTSSGLHYFNRSSWALNTRHALEYFTPVVVYLAEKVVLKLGSDKFLERYKPVTPQPVDADSAPQSSAEPQLLVEPVSDHDDGHSHSHGHSHGHGHGAACAHGCIHGVDVKPGAPAWIKYGVDAVKLGHDVYHWVAIVHSLFGLSARMKIVNALYQDIVALNSLIFDCQRIVLRVEEVPALRGMLSMSELARIKSLIDEHYFIKNSSLSVFSKVGKTLVTYNAVQRNLEIVRKLIKSLAALDVYVAVARTMLDAQAAPERCGGQVAPQFCFAEFVEYPRPFVEMKGGWHLMLKKESVQVNSFAAGAFEFSKNYVLSGPTGSGKSGFLRTLGVNAVLAQVFGIAAAEKFCVVPFHKIMSFMTVIDDIAAGKSSFIARMLRSSMCLAAQESLEEGQCCLALLDDSVGQGTTVERGEKTAYEFIQNVGSNKATILVAATHYDRVKNLGAEPESGFANIRMRVKRDLTGKVSPEYLLEQGISDSSEVGVLLAS